ncbi:MAG TPA: hypothetical protein VIY73_13545 [Polyangiaceae bacterium]
MAADAEITVKPGDVLAGKYKVERVLGQGGMGVVVAARSRVLSTTKPPPNEVSLVPEAP